MLKRLVALFLVVLMSINGFAAAVSDNDGSVFITKAEFDSLKNSFQYELNDFNQNIDTKLDSAIDAYIKGVKSSENRQVTTIVDYAKKNYVYAYDANDTLEYKYGWPIFWGDFSSTLYTGSGNANREVGITYRFDKGDVTDSNKQNKTTITSLQESTTTGSYFAKWYGFLKDCVDTLYFSANSFGTSDGNNAAYNLYKGIIATGQGGTDGSGIIVKTNQNLIGNGLWWIRSTRDGYDGLTVGSRTFNRSDGVMYIITPMLTPAVCRGIEHDWGERLNDVIVINKSYNYDMFSNFDRDYNWGYLGSYKTNFISGFAKKNKDRWTNPDPGGYNKTNNPNILKYCVSGTLGSSLFATDWTNSTTRDSTNYRSDFANIPDYTNTDYNTAQPPFYFPLVGFERTYLTNWSQIVNGDLSTIAKKEVNLHATTTGIWNGQDGEKYLSVCAGLPVADLGVGQQLSKLSLSFSESGSHIVWFSNRPFNPTIDPQSNTNLISNMEGGTYNSTYKGYVVNNQKVDFKYMRSNYSSEEIIYMKWAKFTAPSTIKANTGVKLGNTYGIIQN